ncbi:MAG: sensor histidine kinase [Coriobacteriales bacterium]|nr:sensor histidine kinase [Coriobacteriales bacterium]
MTERDSLIDFVSAVSGDAYLKVEENLGDGYVRLKVSEAERRQAKHDIRSVEDIVIELLRNARDAHARRIFLANHREGEERVLTIIDDGVGVPASLHERIFEPRVTSKLESMVIDEWGVHGRGMALFSIRSNVASARIAASDHHKGASIHVVARISELGERADQSTWPTVERNEEGFLRVVRGPHNVVRRTVEFALEHPGLEVYLGSPTEIVATMFAIARDELDSSDLLFCDNLSRLPVWQRAAAASDAVELTDVTAELGVPVSERTAHRVLAGELHPLRHVMEQVSDEARPASDESSPDIYRDRRGLRIHHTDLAEFRRDLEQAFDTIAERYYLQLRCEPKVTVGRDEIRVRFEVDKED